MAINLTTHGDWRTKLPGDLHCFAGNYHKFPGYGHYPHRCFIHKVGDSFEQAVALKLAPPLKHEREKPSYFKADAYAKHLIGLVRSWSMFCWQRATCLVSHLVRCIPLLTRQHIWNRAQAFSVPAMEVLLKPLQAIYKRRSFPEYEYLYAWEGANNAPFVPPSDDMRPVAPVAAAAAAVNMDEDSEEEEEGPTPDKEDDRKPASQRYQGQETLGQIEEKEGEEERQQSLPKKGTASKGTKRTSPHPPRP